MAIKHDGGNINIRLKHESGVCQNQQSLVQWREKLRTYKRLFIERVIWDNNICGRGVFIIAENILFYFSKNIVIIGWQYVFKIMKII